MNEVLWFFGKVAKLWIPMPLAWASQEQLIEDGYIFRILSAEDLPPWFPPTIDEEMERDDRAVA